MIKIDYSIKAEILKKRQKNKAMRPKQKSGAPKGIRTPALSVRSRTLYPAELLAHLLSKSLLDYYSSSKIKIKSYLKKIQGK